jgi:hypothetical protein
MAKIGRQSETNDIKDYRVANLFRNIMDMVDGRLTIDDNIQGKIIRNVLFISTTHHHGFIKFIL